MEFQLMGVGGPSAAPERLMYLPTTAERCISFSFFFVSLFFYEYLHV